MIRLHVGWFSPYRAGGFWAWLGDIDWGSEYCERTVFAEICILGLSVALTVGAGEAREWRQ